jgi:pimeloyl-ACP methyl ester carboxylesterase
MALREIEYKGNIFKISYEIFPPKEETKKDIIFLHGWGSNKEVMKVFRQDFEEFRQIYIDMPGFGKSSAPISLTTFDYAKIIDAFLLDINAKKDVIISHSFGGKVGLLLKPKLLVLLASAGIIEKKPASVRFKIALYKLLKKFTKAKFRDFFVSKDVKGMGEVMYLTFKNVVNENFDEIFKSYDGEVLIFGAKQDKAVTPNAIKQQSQHLNTDYKIFNGEHYFFLDEKNRKELVRLIKERMRDE